MMGYMGFKVGDLVDKNLTQSEVEIGDGGNVFGQRYYSVRNN